MRSLRFLFILLVLSQLALACIPQTRADSSVVSIPDKLGVSTTVDTASGQISVSKWANEVNLGLTLEGKPTSNIQAIDKTTLQYAGFKQEVVTTADGIELNIVLSARPASNTWIWDINTKGLNFYYQPPLDSELDSNPFWVTVNATHAFDKDGNLVAYRPLNVVGSYAVYGDNKDNEYGTGKVAQIYRPLVTDAKGSTTWGTLNVSGSTLSISVDNKWLDSATYPVTIDPNIGYTTAGVTVGSIANAFSGSLWNMTESGFVTSMTAYVQRNNVGTASMKMGIYRHSDLAFMGGTVETTVTYTQGWVTASINGSPTYLSKGTGYILFGWAQDTGSDVTIWYDSGGTTNQGHYEPYTYQSNFPNPLPSVYHDDKSRYSVYATYSKAYFITPTVGNHGSISPSVLTAVVSGGSQAFTISPQNGYAVQDLIINGVPVTSSNSYTFNNVGSNQTILVDFNIPIQFNGIYAAMSLAAVGSLCLGVVVVLSVTQGNIDPKMVTFLIAFTLIIIFGTYIIGNLEKIVGG